MGMAMSVERAMGMIMSTSTGKAMDMIMSIRTLTAMDIPIHTIHRNLSDIYRIIERLDSKEEVKELARNMFLIVAEAEAKAHGLPIDEVHFHEVGAIDSIVDIISVAVCLDNLGVKDVVVSPLAEGHGQIRCQHGVIPVPVPATANIAAAHGLALRADGSGGRW